MGGHFHSIFKNKKLRRRCYFIFLIFSLHGFLFSQLLTNFLLELLLLVFIGYVYVTLEIHSLSLRKQRFLAPLGHGIGVLLTKVLQAGTSPTFLFLVYSWLPKFLGVLDLFDLSWRSVVILLLWVRRLKYLMTLLFLSFFHEFDLLVMRHVICWLGNYKIIC